MDLSLVESDRAAFAELLLLKPCDSALEIPTHDGSVVDGAWTIPIDFRTDDLTDFFEYVAKRRRRRREKRARRRRDQYRS